MKLKTLCSLVAAAGLSVAAASAQAAIVVDGWQMNTGAAGIASNTINIGHLNLSGGNATVVQEVNGAGNPFVGARFTEFGAIFSTAFTAENVAGAGDNGFPQDFNGDLDGLRIRFDNLSGVLTSVSGTGELEYTFTPGSGSIFFEGTSDGSATWVELAEIDLVGPSGGDLNDFFGAAQTNGNSSITGIFLSAIAGLLSDSSGNPFDIEDLLIDVATNNTISAPASAVFDCSATFGQGAECRSLEVNSDGSLDLLRVPEPATLGLLGVSLIGLAAARRRKVA